MDELLKHVAKMNTQGLLALVLLVLVVAGYKALDWWLKGRIEANKEAERTRRREHRNRELAEQLAAVVTEQRRMHVESHEQLLALFREDRAALAQSLVETIDGGFSADDRLKLTRMHNAHLGDGARRTDGTLRWHSSERAEQAVMETRDDTRKLVDLAAEQRDAARESGRLLARLEARTA